VHTASIGLKRCSVVEREIGGGVEVIGFEFAQPDDFGGAKPLSDDDEEVWQALSSDCRPTTRWSVSVSS
jgi:hypothetical protein